MSKIFSFDIFDTCITRACGKVENVFFLLASECIVENNKSSIYGFIHDRKHAEEKAMRFLKKDSVRIEEIYEFFNTSVFTTWPKKKVMEREIEIDINSYLVVRNTLDTIHDLRLKGNRIIFISDMYLPKSILRSKLVQLGIAKETDSIYISCECGLSKYTGRLFDFVQARENVRIKDWTHYGDDTHNDYNIPKIKGINAILVNSSFSCYEQMWERESKILGNRYISIISSIIRNFRLCKYNNNEDEFVPDLMASQFIPFTLMIMKKAREDGIKRLYFASRDTYLWYRIAKLARRYFEEIEVEYIHVSTKVLYPAYIKNGSPEEICKILSFVQGATIARLLRLLCFKDDEIEMIGHNVNLNQRITTDEQRSNFIKLVLSKDLKSLLLNRCSAIRSLVIDYFRQEGLFTEDGTITGLVDLGWNGTCQFVISSLGNYNVRHYYYGRQHYKSSFDRIGSFYAGFYADDIPCFDKIILVVEYFMCRTLEGSTIGYEKDSNGLIIPKLEKVEPTYPERIANRQEQVLELAERFLSYKMTVENAEVFFRMCSFRSLLDFVESPKYHLIKDIADELVYNHLSQKSRVIIKWPILHNLKHRINKRKGLQKGQWDLTWNRASIVYTYGNLGEKIVQCNSIFRVKNTIKKIIHV